MRRQLKRRTLYCWQGGQRDWIAPGSKKQVGRPPCSNLRSFGSKCTVLYWRKYLWHCWDFSAPGELWPPCPLVRPLSVGGYVILDELEIKIKKLNDLQKRDVEISLIFTFPSPSESMQLADFKESFYQGLVLRISSLISPNWQTKNFLSESQHLLFQESTQPGRSLVPSECVAPGNAEVLECFWKNRGWQVAKSLPVACRDGDNETPMIQITKDAECNQTDCAKVSHSA